MTLLRNIPIAFAFAADARWWEQHIADLHELAEDL